MHRQGTVQPPKYCPQCGTQIAPGQKHCGNCGATFCPACGTIILAGHTTCPRCNYLLGSAMPGTTGQQPPPTPHPPLRHFPSSQGGIIGRQPSQQPRTPAATPVTPTFPAATPKPHAAYDQSAGAYGPPSRPKRIRQFPARTVAIIILIIVIIGAGFVAFKAGWLEAPLSNIQEFASEIEFPQWLPIVSKDTTPPVISEVNVSEITQTGAVVIWQTDEPATSQVMICDPGGGCTWTELAESLVTSHSVNLSGLKPNVTYKITASSMDARENQQTYEGSLTTLSHLQISGVNTSQITDSSAMVNWVTDKPATSRVEYGTTDVYGSTTQIDENLTTSHIITLAKLKPNTIYHFSVKSKDASGNEVSSQDQTFTTRGTAPVTAEVGTEKGKRAPSLTLPSLDGKMVSLSDFQGKIVIISFWTSRIQCRTQLSFLEEVYEKWPQKAQLEILAINVGEPDKYAQTAVDELGLTFTVLLDKDQKVAKMYEVASTSTPVTFFIDSQGIIRYKVSNRASTVPDIQDKLNSLQSPP